MNYSRVRTANPLALGLEMSSLAFFSRIWNLSFITLSEPYTINYSGLLINNRNLFGESVQAWGLSGRC